MWKALGHGGPSELRLGVTLLCGQVFRFKKLARALNPSEVSQLQLSYPSTSSSPSRYPVYLGVLFGHVLEFVESPTQVYYRRLLPSSLPSASDSVLHDWLNSFFWMNGQSSSASSSASTAISLTELSKHFAERDPKLYSKVISNFEGVRVLRQDPFECLTTFILSSNNNVLRIMLLVEKIAAKYGTPLGSLDMSIYSHPEEEISSASAIQENEELIASRVSEASSGVPSSSEIESAAETFASSEIPAADVVMDDASSFPSLADRVKSRSRSKSKDDKNEEAVVPKQARDKDEEEYEKTEQQLPRKKSNGKKATITYQTTDLELKGGMKQFFAFPTLEQLSKATEEELRALGLGYRAKYIASTSRALLKLEQDYILSNSVLNSASSSNDETFSGSRYLSSLRSLPRDEILAKLMEFDGVGPKVASCVALYSCDQHQEVPMDTHMIQVLCRFYSPKYKSVTAWNAKRMREANEEYEKVFGPFAGWAQLVLFAATLNMFKDKSASAMSESTKSSKKSKHDKE